MISMDEFIDLFAEAMVMDKAKIKPNDQFRKYKEWDSMAALDVVTMLKTRYNTVIPQKEFKQLLTLSELFFYVLNKAAVAK